jgi:hypothetical protein
MTMICMWTSVNKDYHLKGWIFIKNAECCITGRKLAREVVCFFYLLILNFLMRVEVRITN